jgi:quinoprotein glucose dehydrogenase
VQHFVKISKRTVGVCGVIIATVVVTLPFSAATPKPAAVPMSQAKAVSAPKAAAASKSAVSNPRESSRSKEWFDYAGSPEGDRYVDLKQITKSNVTNLDVAWSYPYAETNFNPIVAHGVIYTKARNKSLVAINAATGKEIWIHDGLTNMTERGMNYWESADGKDRRLIFSVSDYLQEIDANTGKSIRTFGNNGAVDLREGLRRDINYMRIQSGTPGKVFENLILLGSATGEGYFSPPGDLRAFDILTGKLVWQFHTVPHPGEPGYETWPKDAWKYIGGVNTWGELTIDSKRAIAYFPTGSATFDYYGADRVGNDLYANCLIALDVRTGKLLWYFQTVHHDLWDFDNVAAPMLTTIVKDGKKVDVVAQAGKTGWLYVFDRVTGKPIWPIPETPVPHETKVPGEVVSPTQPIPSMPPPFNRHSFTTADVNPYILTPDERQKLIDKMSKGNNQGMFTPISFIDTVHMPGNHGGANWGMTSANPTNGVVYVASFEVPAILKLIPLKDASLRGAAAAANSPGAAVFAKNCAVCHGPTRQGNPTAGIPALTGVASRLNKDDIQSIIASGKGQMPSFHEMTANDIDSLTTYLMTADLQGGGAFNRSAGPTDFPPGPIAETGPTAKRPTLASLVGGMTDYPSDDADAPKERFTMDGYGLLPGAMNPPYTTFTAFDLNTGSIKWQIGLGDDYRVVKEAGLHGTGAAQLAQKNSSIITSTGLVIIPAPDRRIHFYDADNGKELYSMPVGANSTGSPSMYELNGKQYLLVTAADVGMRGGAADPSADPNQKGPVGLIAIALQ